MGVAFASLRLFVALLLSQVPFRVPLLKNNGFRGKLFFLFSMLLGGGADFGALFPCFFGEQFLFSFFCG